MSESMGDRLEAMLAAGQDNPLLRFGLGNNYCNEKAWPRAIEHLKALLEQDANHSAGWKLLGRALAADGQTDEAIAVYQQGLEVAAANGDKQVVREIEVFLRKLEKQNSS